MKILGIETSCDETAAAVVEDGEKLLSNVVASSIDLHKAYGGVVPEIAARSHIESINPVIREALDRACCSWQDIDGIAVTYGPGLSGSLLVGVLSARTLAIVKNKPLFPVNHVEAHVYASFLTGGPKDYRFPVSPPSFPLLALIVSGGHSQLVLFKDHFDYQVLGKTHDDAAGEAFDKVAKMLGLPYPGGPSIENAAKQGDENSYDLPTPKTADKYGFSYSGLKTAVLRKAQQLCGQGYDFPSHRLAKQLGDKQRLDLAASFQRVALAQLADKTTLAYRQFQPENVVVAGGVAASFELRRMFENRLDTPVIYADPQLCTDNGAMVASLGCFARKAKKKPADPRTLEINPGLSM